MPVNPPKPVTKADRAVKLVRPYGRLAVTLALSAAVLLVAGYSVGTIALVLGGELIAARA